MRKVNVLTLIEIKNLFIKKSKIFFIVFFAIEICGFVYIVNIVPSYSAISTILISPIANSDKEVNPCLIQSFFDTPLVKEEISIFRSVESLNLSIGQLDLSKYKNSNGKLYSDCFELNSNKLGKIIVKYIANTNIIEVLVKDENIIFATDLANILAINLHKLLIKLSYENKISNNISLSGMEYNVQFARISGVKFFFNIYHLATIVILAGIYIGGGVCYIFYRKSND